MPGKQYKFWILTIPENSWAKPTQLPEGVSFCSGQLECGLGTGYRHFQLVACFTKAVTLTACKRSFTNDSHCEPSRSSAANEYCLKDDTAIPGSQFTLGQLPLKRNSKKDWVEIKRLAQENKLDDIDPDIYMRHYGNIRKIAFDNSKPVVRGVQNVNVYWGETGAGKTKKVFEECGDTYYIKSSSTKWWDGYHSQENVIIDEFTGQVSIEHLLKWFDRYPCSAEIKGGQVYLNTKSFWITSNVSPDDWYPDVPDEQKKALRRRLTNVIHFLNPRSILNKST